MGESRFPVWPTVVVAIGGVALHTVEIARGSDGPVDLISVLFFIYGLLPYGVALVVVQAGETFAFPAFVGSFGGLALDLFFYYDVFLHPASSTAALVMLFAPLVCIAFGVVPGMLLGYLAERLYRRLGQDRR